MHAEEDRRLHQALRRVLDDCENTSDTIECLRLPRDGRHRDLLAMIYPLPDEEEAAPRNGSPDDGNDPAAIILLSDPERQGQLPKEIVARLFDLTPTEAHIALALAEGWRTADIAHHLGVSITTVNFHLRNLFQKTDTHRQAELVALVLAGSMTLTLE